VLGVASAGEADSAGIIGVTISEPLTFEQGDLGIESDDRVEQPVEEGPVSWANSVVSGLGHMPGSRRKTAEANALLR
jgi:hypothetical protein